MLNNIIKLLVHLLKECKKKRSARSTSSSINKYANINKEIHFIINTYLVEVFVASTSRGRRPRKLCESF